MRSSLAEPLEPVPVPLAPESRQVAPGKDLRLDCEVAEAGEVVWLKGKEHIQPSGRFQILCQGAQQTLVIQGFSAEDQGEYLCGPARDPFSAAAKTFHGESSRAQHTGVEELGGAIGGPLGEFASHQGWTC